MTVLIMGGGTFSDVAPHLSLCTKAFGTTAKRFKEQLDLLGIDNTLVLTKMADSESDLVTSSDVIHYLYKELLNPDIKAIIFNVAMCDFYGSVDGQSQDMRLSSDQWYDMSLFPVKEKAITLIKRRRPDIFLVGFKTTAYDTESQQINKAIKQINVSKTDLVFANDIGTRKNFLVTNTRCLTGDRQILIDSTILQVIKACYPSQLLIDTHLKDSLEQYENMIYTPE